MSPLLNVLKVEQIGQLYSKHKIYGSQFLKNELTFNNFMYLKRYYNEKKANNESFMSQFANVSYETGSDIEDLNLFSCISKIDGQYQDDNEEIKKSLNIVLNKYEYSNSFFYIKLLNDLLYVEF